MAQSLSFETTQILLDLPLALAKNYTQVSFEVGAMDLAELQDYLAQHIYIDIGDAFDDEAESIRSAILASQPQLDADVTEPVLWALCEKILQAEGYRLERRRDAVTKNVFFRATSACERYQAEADTPRDAILKCFVKQKTGH